VTADLTFEALRGTDTYQGTLAYWLGLLGSKPWPPAADGPGLHNALSFQYDIEEQAGHTGRLFPEDVDWRKSFQPIAPIQLTKGWSPLPYAMEVVGPPDWSVCESGPASRAAGVAWLSSRLERVKGTRLPRTAPADQRRFLQLLTVGAMRGLERDKGLLITACPGWSYDHGTTFDTATQGDMRRARFAVTDRRAKDGDAG